MERAPAPEQQDVGGAGEAIPGPDQGSLVAPDVRWHRSLADAVREFAAEGRSAADGSAIGVLVSRYGGRIDQPAAMAEIVAEAVGGERDDVPRPPGLVPSTTLWWVAGDRWLGRIAIRHQLSAWLLEVGGHIGYDVRPSARRRGHATAMLRAALPVAASLGIDPALITCDETNVASRKVIEACGGELEDVRPYPGDPRRPPKRRYWVPTR